MRKFRIRLWTIMVVVAFVALVLTVLIQGMLLHKAAVAKQNEMAEAQQSQAASEQRALALLKQLEQDNIESIERMKRQAQEMHKFASAMDKLRDTLSSPSEETQGGFRRWVRELRPRPDETEHQGHEHD